MYNNQRSKQILERDYTIGTHRSGSSNRIDLSRIGLVYEVLCNGTSSDTSINGLTVTNTNGTFIDTDIGYQSKKWSGNGTNAYMYTSHNSIFDFGTNTFTVEYRLNPTAITLYKQPMNKYSSANNGGWSTQMGASSASKGVVYMRQAGTVNETVFETTATGFWEANKMIMYTFVVGTSSVKFYKNGILFETVNGTRRDVSNSSAELRIARSYASDYLGCSFQEGRIYNGGLTDKEIYEHYKEGLKLLH